ncbi:hypothetical protein HNQ77_002343 [Silvibacterium bohemicum]|uniref:Aminoglycoside phosphotransferase domain-containing protein n=1 Tax=Silvibacterium bohemicum TaxID=1577686 RepID=A0A841JZK2_9BACT|nr:hypothetical protein [Silvibacterium bohemicum]MBB6144391.1 hypothetical protein [Silvibacterium bohemicum]
MTSGQPNEDHAAYRLLLVVPRLNLALLEEGKGRPRLPHIDIPRYTRTAEQITEAVYEIWALRTVVIDWLHGHDEPPYCAVLEILNPWPSPCGELRPVPIAQISEEVLPSDVLATVNAMLDGNCESRGPFSRFGWIKKAEQWVRDCAEDQALNFTDVRQFNASGAFALVRFGSRSSISAYWLKAVGEPNAHEFVTTSYLVDQCPEYLPKIIGMRGDWNAWIMEEFGSSLHSSDSLVDFEMAAIRLAHLQKKLVGRTHDLLASRFIDHRLSALISHIDELIDFLEEAMRTQTSTRVPVLSRGRLREIGRLLHESCGAMDTLAIPDSVMHSDISPGSILGDGIGCVFTDWCEAYVGNPFVTLEQLCVHTARKTNDPTLWRASLTSAYCSCWRDVLTEEQIGRALEYAPLISVLSYLHGRGDWLHSTRRQEAEFQSYARSLARHMDRLAASNGQTGVEWQSV